MQTRSIITCPKCGEASIEPMPTDAWFFYICRHCSAALQPLAGDCWVFCSYADVPYLRSGAGGAGKKGGFRRARRLGHTPPGIVDQVCRKRLGELETEATA